MTKKEVNSYQSPNITTGEEIGVAVSVGVARGALGARAPQGGEKNLGPNLQGKVVSAPSGCNL